VSTSSAEDISYEELAKQNALKNVLIDDLRAQVQALTAQVRSLKSHVFGRKSERFIPDTQGELFAPPDTPPKIPEQSIVIAAHERRQRGRKPLPKELPRERVEYEPEIKSCACCGEEMPKIGEEITEELEFIPASFKIVEHVRIKRACPRCKAGVEQGELPAGVPVIEKGRPGPGLLAHILLSKYCDHLPLNRQEQIFSRHGVEIPRQRMCDWIGVVVEQILLLIALALKRSIRASPYIRADETELEVQTEEKDGKLHLGRLWGILSHEKDLYFEYAESRSSEVAKALLSGVKACVQTDQYVGYEVLSAEPDIIRSGCWDHVRRKFFEAKESAELHAKEVLRLIGELYRIEREYKEKVKREQRLIDFAERAALRQQKSKPVLDGLKRYLDELALAVLPKSPLGKAIAYAFPIWTELSVFIDHGIVELSNAAIEQSIRPIALGRNNWLFAGSDRGAKWAAVMYSIIGTCKLNGVNPYDYLVDVLRRAPAMPRSSIASELTPRAWKQARKIKSSQK
jgi:transposase